MRGEFFPKTSTSFSRSFSRFLSWLVCGREDDASRDDDDDEEEEEEEEGELNG